MKRLRKINPYIRVAIFYALACAWSWPFFWWRDMHRESWNNLPLPTFLKTWSYMWGPGLAAIVCFILFKTANRSVTFWGSSIPRSVLTYLCPIIILYLLTFDNKLLAIAHLGFISMLGEELGWRGWLQDNLPIKSDVKKSLVIGVLWEFWHFTNRTSQGNLLQIGFRVGLFLLLLSAISFVMIKLTKRTASLWIAVTIHFCFNLLFENPIAWQAILLSLPFWFFLLKTWPQPTQPPPGISSKPNPSTPRKLPFPHPLC